MINSHPQVIKSQFEPHHLLQNQHLQTLWPTLFRIPPKFTTQRERLYTLDGDFLDLDWAELEEQPLIILIHGLASSSEAKYIKGLQHALRKNGYASVALNLRGCSGSPNQRAQSYHGGVSHDLDYVITTIQTRFPERPLAAAGFSLGANVLLKWMAENAQNKSLFAGIAVSAPLLLNMATERLNQGFSKVYEQYLLHFMKKHHQQKINFLKSAQMNEELKQILSIAPIESISSIGQFDELITAPLHGFKNAQTYYNTCSARPMLKNIQAPTLIIHSKDDPFMPPEILPEAEELSGSITLEVSNHGGHVGFIGVTKYGLPKYWLEERIPQYFNEKINLTAYKKPSHLLYEYPMNY